MVRHITLDDGRKAEIVRAHRINYANGFVESGFARGLGQDDFYIRLVRHNETPMLWCARRDELEAFITVIGSALYIDSIVTMRHNGKLRKRKARKSKQ